MARLLRLSARAAFGLYVVGLVVWLLLGMLPTLAHDVPAVHDILAELAISPSGLGRLADRVLTIHPDELTSSQSAWIQYGFSLLNLTLGLVLAARRFDQLVPRLLAFALLGTAATFNDVSHRAFHITGSPWPVAMVHFTFHVVSGVAYFWAVVLFPNGTLPQSRLISPAVGRTAAVVVTAGIVAICWFSSFLLHPQFFVVFFGIAVPIVGAAAQLLRLRDPGAGHVDQTSARLLLAALLPAAVVAVSWLAMRALAVTGVEWPTTTATAVETTFPVVFGIVPVVLTAGVVRYRLWNLDRLLVKVLVYGLIGALIAGTYVVAVVSGRRLVGDAIVWLVVLLAIVAAAVEPLRTRATHWANRVVYGQRLSPDEALRDLIGGFETLTPHGTLEQLERVATAATRANSVTVWVIDGDQLVRASGVGEPAPLRDSVAARSGAADSWPIGYLDETLGYLTVATNPDVHLTDGDRRLLSDLATHAGLLVHNMLLSVRLIREIEDRTARTAELRRSRRQLVEAQDTERRRLERDLHDGAQQAVVAGIIGLRIVPVSADPAAELIGLTDVLATGRRWIDDLAEPGMAPVLAELGLAGALRQSADIARRSGLTVTVTVDLGEDQLLTAAHAAVYFCCSEALQNAVKHARAGRVDIGVTSTDEAVLFVVADDGRGFDGMSVADEGGLGALAHRCALLGGELAVDSRIGGGTRIRGMVPLPLTPQNPPDPPGPPGQRDALAAPALVMHT